MKNNYALLFLFVFHSIGSWSQNTLTQNTEIDKKVSELLSKMTIEEKFGRKAVDGHRTRPDGTDLKWKQIGVKEITDSRELPFFIEWLTEDHPSKDGSTVSKIEKIVISDKDQLSDSWFKSEILNGLDKISIDWVDPSTQDGETGIVSVHLSTPNGSVVLD
mgnify:CR=1 FL=1